MRELCTVSVLPRLTDHHPVSLRLEVALDVSPQPTRKVWDWSRASWRLLQHALADYPCRELLNMNTVDDAIALFEDVCLNLMRAHIPEVSITIDHRAYGWVNHRWRATIAAEAGLSGIDLREAVLCTNAVLDENTRKTSVALVLRRFDLVVVLKHGGIEQTPA